MKNLLSFLIGSLLMLTACNKIDTSDAEPIVIGTTDKVLFSGTFSSDAHTTSGGVKLIESADKKKYLVFDNLKSDAGPDLRIYLSEDKTARAFTEVTNKVVNGNTKIEVPSTADTDKQKTVLIWCKQFSVLFGSAALK